MANDLKTIGFVGFGAMPSRMAERLRKASFSVVACDPSHPEGEVDGFRMMPSAKALAQEVDAVLVCVPNDAALETSTQSSDGALEGTRQGQLMIDFSTVSPGASRALGKAAGKRQVRYVEAPMSGSTPEAEKGELVFLAGGESADVEAAAPILDVLGRKTVHAGPVGQGAITKLVINGVMAMGAAALAEGLAYGVRSGVDRDMLIDTLSDLILVSEQPQAQARHGQEERVSRAISDQADVQGHGPSPRPRARGRRAHPRHGRRGAALRLRCPVPPDRRLRFGYCGPARRGQDPARPRRQGLTGRVPLRSLDTPGRARASHTPESPPWT